MADAILIHESGPGQAIGVASDAVQRSECTSPCCEQVGTYYKATNCFDTSDEVYIPSGSTCQDASDLSQSVVRASGACYDVDDTVIDAEDLPPGAVLLTEQEFECSADCLGCERVYRLERCLGSGEDRYVRESVLQGWLDSAPDVLIPTENTCSIGNAFGTCYSFRLDRMIGPTTQFPGMKFVPTLPGTIYKWCCECQNDCSQADSFLRGCRFSCDDNDPSPDRFEACERNLCTVVVSVQESARVERVNAVDQGTASGTNIWTIDDGASQTLVSNGVTTTGICRVLGGTGRGGLLDFLGGGSLSGWNPAYDTVLSNLPGDICDAVRLLNGGIDDCPNACNTRFGFGCGGVSESYSGPGLVTSGGTYTRVQVNATFSSSDSCEGATMAWSIFVEVDYVLPGTGGQTETFQGSSQGSYSVEVIRDGGSPNDCPPSGQRSNGVFTEWGYV